MKTPNNANNQFKSGWNTAEKYLEFLLLENIKSFNYSMSIRDYKSAFRIMSECIDNFYPYLNRKSIVVDKGYDTYYNVIEKLLEQAENNIFSSNGIQLDTEAKQNYTSELKIGVKNLAHVHRLLMDCMHQWSALLPVTKMESISSSIGSS